MTPSPLHCPYCRSEFPEQATVCAACTRDIAPFVSLIKQVQALTDRVQEIEEAGVSLQGAGQVSANSLENTVADSLEHIELRTGWIDLIRHAVPVWITLQFLHWFLFFVHDTSAVWLRAISIALPISVALWTNRHGDLHFLSNALVALVLASLSVFGMLGVTALIDHTPWLPNTLVDWRETSDYLISIALGWVTGYLISKIIVHTSNKLKTRQGHGRSNSVKPASQAAAVPDRLVQIVTYLAPIVSGLVSVYSGLKTFIDK